MHRWNARLLASVLAPAAPAATAATVVALGLALAVPQPAQAAGQSLGPEPMEVFEGNLNYVATAGSLLECGGGGSCALNSNGNCAGLDSGSAALAGVPQELAGLRVRYAQLTWVASLPEGDAPDTLVTLTPPGGAPIAVQADGMRSETFDDAAPAEQCQLIQTLCSVGSCGLTFSSQTADVTDALNTHLEGGGVLNGNWRIADVVIPGGDDNNPATALAAIGSLTVGGWSLLVVYEEASLPLRRLYYYQGFELIDGGERRLRPQGFRAPPEPAVDITFFAQEGDAQTTGDGMRLNDTDVENDCNPFNNVFNDTVSSPAGCVRGTRGVDLDSFHLENAIEPEDEDATLVITLPRGDGLVTAGEQIFTNWLMMAFDHRPANFDTLKPEKSAEPPARSVVQPGQQIEYVILVENGGGDFATGVRVFDAPPAGTVYQPGSTTVDVIQIPDTADGNTQLAMGLNLTGIPGIERIAPGERHLVRFRVRVADDAQDGAIITNIASITADGLDEVRTDPVMHPVGFLPDGGFPPPPDMAVAPPPRDQGPVLPPPADAGPEPDGPVVICGPGKVPNAAGECVEASTDGGPERDACPFGAAQGPCGAGTVFVDGQCKAICGEGTHWDPSCDNGCGRCLPDGVESCGDGTDAPAAKKSSGGCRAAGGVDPTPLAGLAALALLAIRRRRRR
jgi:uncharacterized repeat protein (TIGR01451 family)/MYXO-CTERM domain-containing protein